jgi:membrane protein YdbS with pleckstrin-like domain
VAAAPGEQSVLSLWALKPWWCQPWTILLTGIALVLGSWVLLRLWWITALLTMAVLAWWILFLILVPAAWRQEQRAQRLE